MQFLVSSPIRKNAAPEMSNPACTGTPGVALDLKVVGVGWPRSESIDRYKPRDAADPRRTGHSLAQPIPPRTATERVGFSDGGR